MKNIIFENNDIDNSIKEFWKLHNLTENDFYCKHCGKLLIDINELKGVIYNPTIQFKFIKDKSLYKESIINRFSVKGKLLTDKIYFKKLCWDCFHTELKSFIIKNKVKHTWKQKLLRGELDSYYPAPWQSATFYFKFLFDLPDDILEFECSKFDSASLTSFIRRFGEEQGKIKFEEYRKLQSRAGCTLDYFIEKYGNELGIIKYNEVCNSKAVTKENSIKKYGIENGSKLFNEYCEKQSYAGCKLEYFIEKYGKIEGERKYKEINKRKAITLENMIHIHGHDKGLEIYKNWINKSISSIGYSKISQELFEKIDFKLGIEKSKNSYWYEKNGEFEIEVNENGIYKLYRVDYKLDNKIIEFFGDFWHANPKIYKEDDKLKYVNTIKVAKDIWKADQIRIDILKSMGYDVLIVWESDYMEFPEDTVYTCIDFLS